MLQHKVKKKIFLKKCLTSTRVVGMMCLVVEVVSITIIYKRGNTTMNNAYSDILTLNPSANGRTEPTFEFSRNKYLAMCEKNPKYADKHKLEYQLNLNKLLEKLEVSVLKKESCKKLVNALEKVRKHVYHSGYALNTVFNEFSIVKKRVVEIMQPITNDTGKKYSIDSRTFDALMSKYLSAGKELTVERNESYALNIRKKTTALKTVELKNVRGYTDFWVNQLVSQKTPHRYFLAFAALTGRRMIEVVQTMKLDFDSYNSADNTILFSGQAKLDENSERRTKPYRIKLLITTDEQLSVLKNAYQTLLHFRSTMKTRDGATYIRSFDHRQFTNWAGSIRRGFKHEDFAIFRKILDNDFDTGLKNLRAFYVCYLHALHEEEFRNSNTGIQKQSFNAFSSLFLGHDKTDMNTANSYQRYAFK